MLDEPVCIFAHFKEVGLFFCRLHLPAAVRTFAVHKLGLCKEGLAGCAVHSLIISFIDISLVIQLLEDLLHLFFMVCVCSADKFVVGCVHQIPDPLDLPCHIVHEFLWRNACFLSLQLNLLAVLIGSCLKEHIVSLASFVPCDGVRQYDLVSVPDVGLA